MSEEDDIKLRLIEKFGSLSEKIIVKRQRRIFADVSLPDFAEIFEYAVKTLNFSILAAITGLDGDTTFGVIYHLANENGIMLNLHTYPPKDNSVITTITPYFPAAEAYERELVDLLGIQVSGLPQGNRYPLPDNWPTNQYPLRKDWKVETLDKKEENKNASL